jgi:histidinol-phosphate/aromatic aminotransferase/cobyric acid decarboxylase-like protein/choline kinase
MQALILAAGSGTRLGSLTKEQTKCMVEVCGETLIERSLRAIINAGIKKIFIVDGFKSAGLRSHVKSKFPNQDIQFIHNEDYHCTNNIYSLFIASHVLLQDDTLLLESDLIYDSDILQSVLNDPREDLAVVDKFKNWHDGTVVTLDDSDCIRSFIPKSEFKFKDLLQYYKTVNIYKFSKTFFQNAYYPFLKAYCNTIGMSEYYEEVLRVLALIRNKSLGAFVLQDNSWYEIDTAEDLANAEVLFSDPVTQYNLLSKRYGGYWRYSGLIDFCFLVNPFFPNKNFNDEFKFYSSQLMGSYPSGQDSQCILGAKMLNIEPDQIVVGNGSAELIKTLPRVLGGNFALFKPTFEEYTSVFKNLTTEFPKNKGFRYEKQDILALSKDKDGFILINPDNPSGNFISRSDILYILDVFKTKNQTLILDESFLDFNELGVKESVCDLDTINNYPNLIIIKSIGKSYGIGGLRLGFLVSSNADLVKKVKSKIPIWNVNSFSEFFMEIIGKYKKGYTSSCNNLIKSRLLLRKELNKISYIECYPSEANYLLCKLNNTNALDLAVFLYSKHKILIKDCSKKCGNFDQYIRVAVRDFEDNQKLIQALKQYKI